jgi:peptidyl-prolyl cis-trans isomerase D
VDREAILLRARAEGFDREAQVQAQMDRFLASLWEQERLAENMEGQFAVTDAEIRAYYEAHAAEFLKPAAVRAGVIKFGVGDNTTVEQRQAVHARANAVRELAARADERGFRQLVQQHSEDQSTRYIGGDTGWIEDGQRTWRWDEAVVEVSRELNQPGEVSELVETGSAVYVVRLLDRRAATLVSLADVSESIRYQVAREHEARRQEAFRNSVREGLAIEVNEPLLESIPVLTNKPHPPAMPGG